MAGNAAIHGLGDWLTNAGRITGLAAGYGVVVLVALMARLPPLERGIATAAATFSGSRARARRPEAVHAIT